MNLLSDRPRVQLLVRMSLALVVVILAVALVAQAVRTARADGAPGPAPAAASPPASPPSDTSSGTPTPSPSPTPTSPSPASAEQPVYTFVSAPDLLNADIGDLRGYPGWKPGTPNSFNKTSDDSLDRLYADMASWNPDAVFVAGDAVRGHWDVDRANTGTFGPVGTPEERRQAIRRAGTFYYQQWKNRFPENGIPFERVYPALGDHEIGDNPWPAGTFALGAVPLFKQVWADNFTTVKGAENRFPLHPVGTQFDDTAYAVYLTPKLLLVTVDTFAWNKDSVSVDVNGKQLEWLRQVLGGTPAGTQVLVQGHVPVLTPVRTRSSSSLHLEDGGTSAFWQVLKDYNVDLYLNGEVHDFTAVQPADGDPVQLSHGGLFAHGTTDYVVGRVYADGRISIDARRMQDQATGEDLRSTMWQTRNNVQGKVRLPDTSTSVGSMVIDDRSITERSGVLAPYDPPTGTVFGKLQEELAR